MSEGHARRAKPSWPRRGRPRRVLWLAVVALPAIVVTPAIAYWMVPAPPAQDDIESVIQQAGFDPLLPPSRLRGPGALYEVEGRFYRKVCDADAGMLQGKIRTSPTESEVSERLQNARFSLGGDLIDRINAALSGARVTAVQFRLTDATISEIPLSDLAEIEDKLLRQKSCDETVQRLLKAHRKVCSGYAVLGATASYRVQVDAMMESGGGGRTPVLPVVRRAIQEETQGQIRLEGDDEMTGEDLFYGIQLSSLCITLDTATEPSVRSE